MALHALLNAIHAHGILRLGPADYLHVQHLLTLRPDLSPAERRAALASLLATNQEQWQQIARLCEQYDLESSSTPSVRPNPEPLRHPARAPQPPPSSPRQFWQMLPLWYPLRTHASRWLLAGLLVGGFILGLMVLLMSLLKVPQLPEHVAPPPPPPAPLVSLAPPEAVAPWTRVRLLLERTLPIHSAPPLRPLDWRDGSVTVLAILLVLLGLRWLRLPAHVVRLRQAEIVVRQQRSALERERLSQDTERQQTPLVLTYQVARYAPLVPHAVDDAATLLGRLFSTVGSDDLDVAATVQHSVQAGGRFVPIFAGRPVPHVLTVLVDSEQGAHPWLDGITWVLERWRTLGVRLVRYDYRFDPQDLWHHDTDTPCTLRDLGRHADSGPLLCISRTLSTQGYQAEAAWLAELPAWPVKAWLDPDPHPLTERRREARQEMRHLEQDYGLQRFPFSADGLLALARYLAAEGQGGAAPAWPPLLPLEHPEVAAALPLWATLAALVPDATWEQLEAIRQHFPELSTALPEPRYVQRLIDWVAREDQTRQPESADGRTLELSEGLVERLIRQQRERDAEQPYAQRLEVRGRQLLLRQLDTTRPEDGLLAQFWALTRVRHGLVLEPERALTFVAALLDSAVGPELLQVVDTELARTVDQPVFPAGTRQCLEVLVGKAMDRVRPGELLGRPWRAWGEAAVGACAAVCLVGLIWWYVPVQTQAWLRRPTYSATTTVVIPAIWQVVKGDSQGDGPKPDSGGNSVYNNIKYITIGISIDLGGPNALLGEQQLLGAKLAEGFFNQTNGVAGLPLILLVRDNSSNNKISAEQFRELIDKEVVAIVGPTTSQLALEIDSIADTQGVPVVAPSNTAADLTKQFTYVSRVSSPVDRTTQRLIAKLVTTKGIKSAVLAFAEGDVFVRSEAEYFQRALSQQSVRLLMSPIKFMQTTTDFTTTVKDIVAAQPDAVIISSLPTISGRSFITQLRNQGYEKPIIGSSGLNFRGIFDDCRKNCNNLFLAQAYNYHLDTSINRWFKEHYYAHQRHTESYPSQFTAQMFTAIQVIVDSLRIMNDRHIRNGNPVLKEMDLQELRRQLNAQLRSGARYQTPLGDITIARDGEMQEDVLSLLVLEIRKENDGTISKNPLE